MNRRQKIVQKQFLDDEEAVIRKLKNRYHHAQKEIEKKAKALQKEIEGLDKLAKLSINDEEKEDILSKRRSKVYQKQYQDSLKKQIDDILNKMHDEEFTAVSEYLNKCYEEGFVGTLYDLQGQGIPLCFPLDQEAMVRAVQLDSKISQGLYTRLGEDVTTLKKKITAQVSRGIATGMTFPQVAKQLAGCTNIGYNNAIRIARTEGHRIQCQSGMDACYKAKDRGADVVKKWDATLDAKTRESHVAVDGEIRELDEKFSNGLMFPGDPSGAAAEVINCRCALEQRARWALEGSFTKMNNFTKKLETFKSPEEYGEFKKAFFSKENRQYMDYVEQMESKYGTKKFEKVLGSMSEREYKHYFKLLEKNPLYNQEPNPMGFKRIRGTHSIADDIGTKQNPICNPNFSKGGDYALNCGYCSATYEMRRRGYDVIANPKHTMLVRDWAKIFKDCKPIHLDATRTNTLVTELQEKLSALGNGARGSLFVQWKGRTVGHFFSWEVKGGQVLFVDAQNGRTDVLDYFGDIKPTKTVCLRWDDLEPSDIIMDACRNRGE